MLEDCCSFLLLITLSRKKKILVYSLDLVFGQFLLMSFDSIMTLSLCEELFIINLFFYRK